MKFLNERKNKNRLIKELTIYSHGIIDNFTFHYGLDVMTDEAPGLLGKNNISNILEEIFDYDAVVSSYACRTGISVESEDFTSQKGEAGQKNSLAQKMADEWFINVKAFERRSDYALTYGTGSDINKARNYQKTIDKYEEQLRIYDFEKTSGKNPVEPKKPVDHEMWIRRMEDERLRNRNQSYFWDNGPIMKFGAWHGVRAGTSPKGLKDGIQTYIPKDYQ